MHTIYTCISYVVALLYFTLGDLYSKINSQRGILFAEEQVCTQKQEFWIMLLLK